MSPIIISMGVCVCPGFQHYCQLLRRRVSKHRVIPGWPEKSGEVEAKKSVSADITLWGHCSLSQQEILDKGINMPSKSAVPEVLKRLWDQPPCKSVMS